MTSRFAQMTQRDCSVDMLRVKLSRRRSRAQKENHDRTVNRHRGLHQPPEPEVSVDGPVEEPDNATPLSAQAKKLIAAGERKKMLARYKEAKELQKEKERRALEKKGGIFKVGLYQPLPLRPFQPAPARTKAASTAPSNEVTCPAKQLHPQKPLARSGNLSANRKAELAVNRVKPCNVVKPLLAPPADGCRTVPVVKTVQAQATKAAKKPSTSAPARGETAPSTKGKSAKKGNSKHLSQAIECKPAAVKGEAVAESVVAESGVAENEVEVPTNPPLGPACPSEGVEEPLQQDTKEDERPPSPSFAPQGFVFEPPAGLSLCPPAALDTLSHDALLTPWPSLDDAPVGVVSDPPDAPETSCPSPVVLPSPNPADPQSCSNSLELQLDVPYFRAAMARETGRLNGLCEQWDPRVEEASIPEEFRDRVRTAVGQARLLIRERFGQFQGLVDDCALGRGEKTTTCTDLQGFWDMVFYQVEDVHRKFCVLEEAESRGWQEEHKPLPPIKRAAKKAPATAAAGSAGGRGGARAAAKSRLAAVKAAMKVKREAEAQCADKEPAAVATLQPPPAAQTVVFDAGFFQVESPAKVLGSARRTSLLRKPPPPCQIDGSSDNSSLMGLSPLSPCRPLPLNLDLEACGLPDSPQAVARAQIGPAAETPDTLGIPGSDFDSCARPGPRCWPSPRATIATVTEPSPDSTALTDGQMEGPRGERADSAV